MKLISVAEMKALEQAANEKGLTYEQMMQNAGKSLAEIVYNRYRRQGEPLNVLGLVGAGNNGGDTLIALISFQKYGWQTYAIIPKRIELINQLQKQFEEAGGSVLGVEQIGEIPQIDIVLDGLIGTGGKPPLKSDLAALVRKVKEQLTLHPLVPTIIAVDCPSGVNCDTGDVPEDVLPAELTVCMGAVKQGLVTPSALKVSGSFTQVGFGLDDVLPDWSNHLVDVIDAASVTASLPDRPLSAHKGVFGKVAVIGGSANYMGAPVLAARAAGRVGAGLVTVASIERVQQNMAASVPEVTWELLTEYDGMIDPVSVERLDEAFSDYAAVLVGPGLGSDARMAKLILAIISPDGNRYNPMMGFTSISKPADTKTVRLRVPLVIDADGLRALAAIPKWNEVISGRNILTPHPGEMAALTGLTVEQIQNDRIKTAQKYADLWNQVVVLKGACTVIASPTGETSILPIATTALAHAGSGDVLSGMIAGLVAQKMEGYKAACAAVYLHGIAALEAVAQIGHSAAVLPGDLNNLIGEAFRSLGRNN